MSTNEFIIVSRAVSRNHNDVDDSDLTLFDNLPSGLVWLHGCLPAQAELDCLYGLCKDCDTVECQTERERVACVWGLSCGLHLSEEEAYTVCDSR